MNNKTLKIASSVEQSAVKTKMWGDKKHILSILVLVIFYSVGIVGLSAQDNSFFLFLTPFNLLLTLVVMLWNHQNWIPSS